MFFLKTSTGLDGCVWGSLVGSWWCCLAKFFSSLGIGPREPFSLGIAEVWSWYIRCVLHLPSGIAFGWLLHKSFGSHFFSTDLGRSGNVTAMGVRLETVSTCGSSLIVGFLDFHNCKANCVDMMYVMFISLYVSSSVMYTGHCTPTCCHSMLFAPVSTSHWSTKVLWTGTCHDRSEDTLYRYYYNVSIHNSNISTTKCYKYF